MSRKIRVGFFFSSLHRAKKTNSINNLTQYEKNYPVKSVRKWFMEFTEYVAGCCNSHIYNLSCRILQYSISQFVLVSGSNSIKIHALGSFSQVCFTVTLELWRLHLRNLLGSFKSIQRTSETAFRVLCPVFMFHLICATQEADKTCLRVLWGIHNDVTHRKYQGGLGTSQGWLFFHGLTSSSVKINRQSEYGTRVHNDIVDFHA